jgi:hypothetical protein
VVTKRAMTGRDALLAAFDRLFEAAAAKLDFHPTPEERAEAKQQFAERFAQGLEVASRFDMPALPAETVAEMEAAIAALSTAQLVGVIAAIPLAQQAQEMLRTLAVRQAEHRLLENFAMQADTRYGGN